MLILQMERVKVDTELQISLMYHHVRIGNKLCKNTDDNVDIFQNTFFACKEKLDQLATKSKRLHKELSVRTQHASQSTLQNKQKKMNSLNSSGLNP